MGFEECRAVGGPPVDHLEEGDLGLVRAHAGVLVVRPRNLLLPLVAGLHLDTVNILRLWIIGYLEQKIAEDKKPLVFLVSE